MMMQGIELATTTKGPAEGAATWTRFQSSFDCAAQTLKSTGVRGLWRGLGVTLARDMPGVGVWITTNRIVKAKLTEMAQNMVGGSSWLGASSSPSIPRISSATTTHSQPLSSPSSMGNPMTCRASQSFSNAKIAISIVSGMAAGVAFWTVALPFDAMKSVIQTVRPLGQKPLSMQAATRHIVQQHGWLGLYRGFDVALLRGVPSSAIVFYIRDRVDAWLVKRKVF